METEEGCGADGGMGGDGIGGQGEALVGFANEKRHSS